MKYNIAGISRKTEFSPNHVLNDFLIVNKTAEELSKLGVEVKLYDESVLSPEIIGEDYIFSMVQGPIGINTLLKIAPHKRFIINSPQSVLNCYRYNMVKLLPENGIPFPKSIIVPTASEPDGELDMFKTKFWLKRGDAHAVHKEDVTLVYTKNETENILSEFHHRGITQAVLQEHIVGDTVKFYAIRDTDFFHWYYVNGFYHAPFDLTKLVEFANSSAKVLDLFVYGGDAIITQDSEIFIIDINDWPSFAPVRDQASKLIAQLIYRKVLENEG
jgi:glutathione synthase/RimK-type ligase-like ATP-grasp enzyme